MRKALIFDMDGLLFDSERIVKRAWNLAGQRLGYGNVGEHIVNTLGMNAEKRAAYFKQTFGADFQVEAFRKLEHTFFYDIREKEGVPLKPGARELLSFAKQKGYRLAVATSSGREYAVRLFQDAGIYDYFEGFVCGDMVTHSKPDPEIYERACEMLRVAPEDCVAFEDAPAGVRSATDAGIATIMVPDIVEPDEETRKRAWKVIRTLDEAILYLT